MLPACPPGRSWLPVGVGESRAAVFRRSDGSVYAKAAPVGPALDELRAERDRSGWLAATGWPAPTPLDWVETPAAGVLVSRALPGVPAADLSPDRFRLAWPGIVTQLRSLHRLPVQTCPFERRLTDMVERAAELVGRGAVRTEFLPAADRSTDPADLLARLLAQADERRRQEERDRVVCHGDACLPNVLVDPETLICTGMVDLGRLGLADPYADAALLVENSRSRWPDPASESHALSVLVERLGLAGLDPGRLRFYRDLDPLTWE